MKKILAIAVATAIAAPAMADMTITGTVAAGYSYNESVAAEAGTVSSAGVVTNGSAAVENTAGFGIDTAAIAINASEEVNGVTYAAAMSAGGFTRGSDVSGENASLSAAGDFGKVTFQAIEAGSGIVGLGFAGAPVEGPEDEVFGGKVNVDQVVYALPMEGPVSVSVNVTETNGIGAGEDGTDYGIALGLNSGMLTAKADYTSKTDATSRIRVSGKIDLGSVVLGAGYETREIAAVAAKTSTTYDLSTVTGSAVSTTDDTEAAAAYDRKETVVGIAVPMGATTFGAGWAKQQLDGTSTNGWTVGVEHKLSANVAVTAKHAAWSGDNEKGSVLLSVAF